MQDIMVEQNKMKRNEDSLRDLWDNINCTIIRIIGVSEGEEKEKWSEKTLEVVIVKNFPNIGKEIVNSGSAKESWKCRESHIE